MGPVERLKKNIIAAIRVGNRPIIWGPAGVGKTSLVNQIGKDMGRMVVTIVPALADPTDVNGFPIPNREHRVGRGEGSKSYPVIEFAPRRNFLELNSHPGGGILFIDELSGGSQSVQSALLKTIVDGTAGDFEFHGDIAIVAAANPPDEAVNGQELGGPMVNRLDHYQYPSHTGTGKSRSVNVEVVNEWCDNFVGWWGDPLGDWKPSQGQVKVEHMIRARSLVSEFIRRRPQLWHSPVQDVSTQGWPSARSWARASRYLALAISGGESAGGCLDQIGSAVGNPAAVEFNTYLENNDLPDPEAVLKDPTNWKSTGRTDVDYAVMVAVVAAVLGNPTCPRVLAALEVANRSSDRKSGSTREAAMVAIKPIAGIIQSTSDAYRKMTKNMASSDRAVYDKEVSRLTSVYGDLSRLLK